MPPYGVYASETEVGGVRHRSITNIGIRPTVRDDDTVTAETNIIDFDEDIYGQQAFVELLHFIRPERKFDSVESLMAQMKKDSSYVEQRYA
jgi:riboflavin kinase/FMN adenylyltransferase